MNVRRPSDISVSTSVLTFQEVTTVPVLNMDTAWLRTDAPATV